MMVRHYIYKFLNADEDVIYVGITVNLKGRIRAQHFTRNGHLPVECYKQTSVVLYSECASSTDAKIKERYLINKLSPAFNVRMKQGDEIPWAIDDFDWKYIGFDNERVHVSSSAGVRKQRVKASSKSLTHILGHDVHFDLSSAVRASPLPDLILLDGRAVEEAAFSWHKHGRNFIYIEIYKSRGIAQFGFSARLTSVDEDKPQDKPLVKLLALLENSRKPEDQDLMVQSLGLPCGRWVFVPTDLNPSDICVRIYTETEQLALAFEKRLGGIINDLVTTPDGWAVMPADGEVWDFPSYSICYSEEYLLLCKSLHLPGGSLYSKGKMLDGNHPELPSYSREFAKYQQQFKSEAGVIVYSLGDLNECVAKHNKLIRQLVSRARIEAGRDVDRG